MDSHITTERISTFLKQNIYVFLRFNKLALWLDEIYQVIVKLLHVVYEFPVVVELYAVLAEQLPDKEQPLLG